ncbi:MAG: hypothetical protein R3F05_19840 [Planctomycetota bacterium]
MDELRLPRFIQKHYDASHKNMQTLQSTYTGKGVVWFSICSSGEGKQGFMTPENAAEKRLKAQEASPTALLLDPTGEIGRRFGIKVTPDMRIIDPDGKVAYAQVRSTACAAGPGRGQGHPTNYIAAFLDSCWPSRVARLPSIRRTAEREVRAP